MTDTGTLTNTGQETADTPITGVTVFTDGARVTRTGVAAVQPGVRPCWSPALRKARTRRPSGSPRVAVT